MTDWDGLPEHPERDGWHWFGKGIAATPCYWNAKMEWWSIPFDHSPQTPFMMKNRGREYIGPVLTPTQAAALYAAWARAGLDAAAEMLDASKEYGGADLPTTIERLQYSHAFARNMTRTNAAKAIRALPLPVMPKET